MHKRYWLRVGLWLAMAFLIYGLFLDWLEGQHLPITAEVHKVLYTIGYPFNFVRFLAIGFNDFPFALVFGDVVATAVFFLVGTFIGLIYGKVKKKYIANV